MAIDRTAANLATFCLQVVGTAYWMGCYGQRASRQLYNEKKAMYSQYYPPKSWTEASFTDDFGKPVTDCAGLPKWFLWSDNMTNKNPTYKSSEDLGATGFWNKCTERGDIKTIPSHKMGLLVFKGTGSTKTHVGVVVDDAGTVVEAKGHAYGTVKSTLSGWDYWGTCHLIKYDAAPPVKDSYTVVTQYDPLTVRKQPTSKSEKIGELAIGYSFVSTDLVEGENINGCKVWVGTSGGYVSGYYLSPTPVLPDPPAPDPPEPTPTPTPTPTDNSYKVTGIHTFLSVRNTPEVKNDDSNKVGELYNGAIVTVMEFKGEWAKISGECWCSSKYLTKL